MSEVSMLSRMLGRYRLTFDLIEGDRLRLVVWDARLDTDIVYLVGREQGASALIVKAYADYRAEYES